MTARTVLLVAAFGALGAAARYGLGGLIAARYQGAFPMETLIINASGSFALGLLFTLLTGRFAVGAPLRSGLTIGFLGAYTTFSTFSFETVRLIEDGALSLGVLNVLLSVAAGLAAVFAGVFVGRAL